MRCLSCGFENSDNMKFCGGCGHAHRRVCPACRAEVGEAFRFCGQCGQSLAETPSAAKPDAAGRSSTAALAPPAEVERRQLTVMFCDLVGSIGLAEQFDPEDLRDVLRRYQQTCAVVIERFDGHVAQFLGDGILVYFGYPQAHEDDARRAVLSGLDIVTEIATLNRDRIESDYGIKLAVRVGMHTGHVVTGEVGAGGRLEILALGQTPNIAARLQGLASANSVMLSDATYALVRGYVVCASAGEVVLRGSSHPRRVYRALRQSSPETEMEDEARALPPPVARSREIDLLQERFRRARDGSGQVVLVVGDPGLGKTRLLNHLRCRIGGELRETTSCSCSPYARGSAFHPWVQMLRAQLHFSEDDNDPCRLDKLKARLAAVGMDLEEPASLLADLLGIAHPDRYGEVALSPQLRRERMVDLILEFILRPAQDGLVLVMIEDLHWMDPSSLEVLEKLVSAAPKVSVFVLLSSRPVRTYSWKDRPNVTQVVLERLLDADAEKALLLFTGGKRLPRAIANTLIQKADGVPLFLEELTKMLLESEGLHDTESGYQMTDALPDLEIPTTLQDSLMARLDRLATAKMLVQVAAVLGREFNYPMLRRVSGLGDENLQRDLAQLRDAEILFQRGVPPYSTYVFKHALIQDAAYGCLVKIKRKYYHRRAAEVLIDTSPQVVSDRPELIAHHCTEGGLTAHAVTHWFKAGALANSCSAPAEAIGHLRKGLQLLRTLEELPDRDAQELAMQLALGSAIIPVRGYSDPSVEKTYARAEELVDKAGDTPELFWVLLGLHLYHIVCGNLGEARRLAERLLRLADLAGDPALQAPAAICLGSCHFFKGEFHQAMSRLDRAVELASPDDQTYRQYTGADLRVLALGFGALTLWHLGFPERALRRAGYALRLAQELSHPHTWVAANIFAGAEMSHYLGDASATLSAARVVVDTSAQLGFSHWLPEGNVFLAWAIRHLDADDAARQCCTVLDCERLRTTIEQHGGVANAYFFGLLTEIQLRQGCFPDALETLECASDLVAAQGERFWDAEILRLRGELAASAEVGRDPVTAEHHLQRAIATAREQGSLSLRLRASLDLGRLWRSLGRGEEAKALVESIYARFTEGFETRDLRIARAFLAG